MANIRWFDSAESEPAAPRFDSADPRLVKDRRLAQTIADIEAGVPAPPLSWNGIPMQKGDLPPKLPTSGSNIRWFDDAQPSEKKSASWKDMSPEEKQAFMRKSTISQARGEHPVQAALADIYGGMTEFSRNVLDSGNLVNANPYSAVINVLSGGAVREKSKDVGKAISNALLSEREKEIINPSSGYHLLGNLADPVSAALGAGAGKVTTVAPVVSKAWKPVQSAVAGGLTGGASAALQDKDVGQGMAYGTVIGGGLGTLGAAASKLRDFAADVGSGAQGQVINYLTKVFGGDKEKIAQALEDLTKQRFLIGEKPTISMASETSNKLGALEKGARTRGNVTEQLTQRDAANEAAIQNTIADRVQTMQVTRPDGTIATVNVPQQARGAVTTPMYEKVAGDILPEDKTLSAILSNPDVAKVARKVAESMDASRTLAQATGGKALPPSIIAGTPATTTPGNALMNQAPQVTAAATPNQYSVEYLKRLNSALGGEAAAAAAGKHSPLGIENLNTSQLNQIHGVFGNWLEQASPGLAAASAKFREMSAPVNQSNFFEALGNKAAQGASQLRTALADLPKTWENATGIPAGSRAQDVVNKLSPVGQRTMEGIENALARRATAEAGLATSPAVLPKMAGPLDIFKNSPSFLSAPITVTKAALSAMGVGMNQKATKLLDEAIADPSKLAAFLREIPPAQRETVIRTIMQQAASPVTSAAMTAQLWKPKYEPASNTTN